MIQRIQSLWLALTGLAALLTLKFSVYSGNKITQAPDTKTWIELNATSNMTILILTLAVAIGSVIAVFLYNDRKLQLRIILPGIALSLGLLILYYNETRSFVEGNFNLTALIALSMPLLLSMALRGVYKDEKLIRSADRLR